MSEKENVNANPTQVEAKIIERLKEIEEELYILQRADKEREQNFSERLKGIEIEKIEKELDAEAKALKEIYPDFDVEAELDNPTFASLVSGGLPMKTAYEVLHLEEIKKMGEEEAGKKALSKYKKTAQRPLENGISASKGGILKSGVRSLSKKDRAELAKRVAKGEIISF